MSLAATTCTTLTLIDGACFKPNVTTYDTAKTAVLAIPKGQVWSPDNNTLYIVSSDAIYAYSPSSSVFNKIYQSLQGPPLQPVLVSRDKSTLIFAQGSKIHLLAVGSSSPKIASSLTSHPAPVISLSLSNDASLLASASASGTLHVHNLAHNSHTVLKGLNISPKNMVCAFHPHARTRLFVAFGKTLIIYDTTRSSGPVKSIPLSLNGDNNANSDIGHAVAVSCSPFSKTLLAVACNSGFVGLVDLEKDKPLFKTFEFKVPVTSMAFSSDGISIAVGTENGRILVQSLRTAEQNPRTLLVGEESQGECVIALSVQKRIRSSSSSAITKSVAPARLPSSLSAPLTQYDLNNGAAKSPARRVVSSSPNTKTGGIPVTPLKGRAKKAEPSRRPFSPPRGSIGDNPGDISVQIETLMGAGTNVEGKKEGLRSTAGKDAARPPLSGSRVLPSSTTIASGGSKTRGSSGITASDRPSSRLTVGSSSGSRKTSIAELEAASSMRSKVSSSGSLDLGQTPKKLPGRTTSKSDGAPAQPRSQAIPVATEVTFDIISSALPPSSSSSTLGTSAESTRRLGVTSTMRATRTPTPDLPSVDEESLTWKNQAQRLNAQTIASGALTTPDVERWVEAGKGKQVASKGAARAKRVGWAVSDGDDSEVDNVAEGEDEEPTVSAAVHIGLTSSVQTTMEISPIRRPHLPSGALQISPMRSSPLRGALGNGGGHGNGGPHELLRAVVKDVMYEYRQETRDDIKGLHLDLLRMGRNWKSELRTMMDEYVGDLRELREENAQLRRENDRLRRGF